MKLRTFISLMTVTSLMMSTSEAAFNRGTGGTASANFLKLGAGARYLGMGESGTATADDVNALYWNPANMGRMTSGSLTLMQNYYVESNYQFVGAALPVGPIGSLGGYIQRFSAGDIKRTNSTGQDIGRFSPRDLAVGFGWGRKVMGNLAAGGSVKFINSKIVESASTVAADAGLSFTRKRVSLGGTIRNMGGKLKFDRESNALPLTIQTGIGYDLSKRWLLSSDIAFPQDAPSTMGIGTEYKIPIAKDMGIGVRGGYNTRGHNVDGMPAVTLGMGFQWSRMEIDYAWLPLGDYDQTHRISFNLGFGSPMKPAPVLVRNVPKDTDGDGVEDDMDDCPGTPSGTPVDNRGCPSEQSKRLPTNDWVLRDVRFDFASAKLKPESMRALDQAIEILKANPTVKVEVQGHTDNIGGKVYNLNLSQQRALSVVKYLMQEGVSGNRLVSKGYADDVPVMTNDTEEGREMNRRMEFKIDKTKALQ